jgi:MinD superfamily P-loop ATPase
VVEPTVSGIHDLDRALGTVKHFGVPALVCINKADLNPTHTTAIEAYCAAEGIEVVGRLPYDTVVTEAMLHGQPVTAYRPAGDMAKAVRETWEHVRAWLED